MTPIQKNRNRKELMKEPTREDILRNAGAMLREQNVDTPEQAVELMSSTQFQEGLARRISTGSEQHQNMVRELMKEQEAIRQVLKHKLDYKESFLGKVGRWSYNTGSFLLRNGLWIIPLAIVTTVAGVIGYRYARDYIEGLMHEHSGDLSGGMIEDVAKSNFFTRPAMGEGQGVHSQGGMPGAQGIYASPNQGTPLPPNLPNFPGNSPGNMTPNQMPTPTPMPPMPQPGSEP